jgi:hypothetical protein
MPDPTVSLIPEGSSIPIWSLLGAGEGSKAGAAATSTSASLGLVERPASQLTSQRLSPPCINLPTADIVPFTGITHRTFRSKGIAQDCQLVQRSNTAALKPALQPRSE